MREICSCDKRYSKVCPLEIGRSVLYFDDSTASYMLVCSLTNAISDTGADSVASAVLVIRAHRADGTDITFMGKDYIAKSLNFTKEGLCVGNSSGNLAFKLDIDDAAVERLEIYVTKIVFVSGVTALFQRNEFYELPKTDISIKSAFLVKAAKEFSAKFGDHAKYVPEKLSPLMWRCTCGEVCMDFVCPKCGADKNEIFEYTKQALADKQAFVKKTRVPIVVSLCVTIALLLTAVITLSVLNLGKDPSDQTSDTDPAQTTSAVTTQNPYVKEKYDTAVAYMERGMYDQALEVAREINHTALIEQILGNASTDYFGKGDFMKAYDYAIRMQKPANIEQIADGAYTQAMEASIHDKALIYAKKLGDKEKIEVAAKAYIVDLKAELRFEDAYSVAEQNSLEELANTLAAEASEHYISVKEYKNALVFAKKTGDGDLIKTTAASAANALKDEGKSVEAFDYAIEANDRDLIKNVVASIKNTDISKDLRKYFEYMSFERKQQALATTVSVSSTVSAISTSGKVYYGASSIYTPSGTSAVSVSSGEAHTVVLLKNGTVKAFGNNSFGQCDVSSWKNVVAVSAGAFHTVALLEDGTVVACGLNTSSQCDTYRFSDVIMISAGAFHTVALKADGTVVSCGMNLEGQCDTSSLTDIKMISAGQTHTLALKDDGTVAAVGSVLMGQADVGGWSDIVYISAGNCFSVGVTGKGNVLTCGKPVNSGSVGEAVTIKDPVAIDAGNVCVAFIGKDGSIQILGTGSPDILHLLDVKFVTNSYFAQ